MNTKKLGNSDLEITPVGFGAWAIGGSGWEFAWGDQDDKASVAAIHRGLELGVNWIDTAAVYGVGHSEEVVARALETWSGSRPYVFTKCGLLGDEQGYVHRNLKAGLGCSWAGVPPADCIDWGLSFYLPGDCRVRYRHRIRTATANSN